MKRAAPDLAVVPYRASSDELETLRRENEALRAELELLRGETMYPFSSIDEPCRKCGIKKRVGQYEIAGPVRTFQPATSRWFWRKATPERFQLTCEFCKAVYYERTKT